MASQHADDDDQHDLNSVDTVPRHVALICDGNSRWANLHNLPAAAGHAAGADRLVHILDHLQKRGVHYCTMYGFSTENWKRPAHEVRDLLHVMERAARQFHARALREQVRVRILGDLIDPRIPSSLREALQSIQRDTYENTRHAAPDDVVTTLCLAINYGGRRDIVQAARRLAAMIADGTCSPEHVTEDTLASMLGTAGIPDPDLIIRTSGETRLSNFLLWNSAYAELYFSPILWPDFDEVAVDEALLWYARRQRRFGARAGSFESLQTVSPIPLRQQRSP